MEEIARPHPEANDGVLEAKAWRDAALPDGELEEWRHKANEAPVLSQSGEEQLTSENFSGTGSSQWLIEAPVRLQARSRARGGQVA